LLTGIAPAAPSPANITIEPYSGQKDGLRNLLRKSWVETYWSELGAETTQSLIGSLTADDVGGLLPGRDESAFLAIANNQIAGSAISAARHGVTYLWGCYVLAEFQRLGIGGKLISQAISVHEPSNPVQITALKSSNSAIAFYQTLGFKTTSDQLIELLPGISLPSITMVANT